MLEVEQPIPATIPTPPPVNLPPEPWVHGLQLWERFLLGFVGAVFVGILLAAPFTRQVNIWKNIWWAIGFPASILGPAFIRARRLSLETAIRRFLPQDAVISDLYNQFVHRIEVAREPLIIGIAAGLTFFLFRLAAAWSVLETLSQSWLMVFMLFFHPFGLGYMAGTVWLLLSFGGLINRLSRELEARQQELFSWELLERMGRSYARAACGAAVLSLGFLAMVLTNIRLFSGELESNPLQVLAMEGVCALALALPFAYLIIPQWRLHRILVHRKTEIQELFYSQFLAIERKFLQQPDCTLAQQYLAQRQIIAEIENLPEWPFRLGALTPMVTVFALPLGLFLLKEVLVDLLVALIKG